MPAKQTGYWQSGNQYTIPYMLMDMNYTALFWLEFSIGLCDTIFEIIILFADHNRCEPARYSPMIPTVAFQRYDKLYL